MRESLENNNLLFIKLPSRSEIEHNINIHKEGNYIALCYNIILVLLYCYN